mgnify:CR=1 FL=1
MSVLTCKNTLNNEQMLSSPRISWTVKDRASNSRGEMIIIVISFCVYWVETQDFEGLNWGYRRRMHLIYTDFSADWLSTNS